MTWWNRHYQVMHIKAISSQVKFMFWNGKSLRVVIHLMHESFSIPWYFWTLQDEPMTSNHIKALIVCCDPNCRCFAFFPFYGSGFTLKHQAKLRKYVKIRLSGSESMSSYGLFWQNDVNMSICTRFMNHLEKTDCLNI